MATEKQIRKRKYEQKGAHLEGSQVNIVKYTFDGNPRFRLHFLLGLSSLSF